MRISRVETRNRSDLIFETTENDIGVIGVLVKVSVFPPLINIILFDIRGKRMKPRRSLFETNLHVAESIRATQNYNPSFPRGATMLCVWLPVLLWYFANCILCIFIRDADAGRLHVICFSPLPFLIASVSPLLLNAKHPHFSFLYVFFVSFCKNGFRLEQKATEGSSDASCIRTTQ